MKMQQKIKHTKAGSAAASSRRSSKIGGGALKLTAAARPAQGSSPEDNSWEV